MVYAPKKYFTGLTPEEKKKRLQTIRKRIKTKNNYRPFPTDLGKKIRPSSYTKKFQSVFPGAKSLENKSKVSGVPLNIIKTVYNRGLAAWITGHRPGASQGAWGHARVHSFIVGGKTATTADSDMRQEAMRRMNIRKWPIKRFR
jgi:hypothetical protein